MRSIHIRPATVADSAVIAMLLDALGYPVELDFLNRSIQRQLDHDDAVLLVAEVEQAVVGVISLHFIPQLALPGDFCRISYLCVSPEARGQGVGTALEEQAYQLAQERGCDRLEVHSHSRRLQAHRFYARQGYAESPKYWVKRVF
ncbi:GNAT family N-acetyltransferase [Leptolyngbya sp. BL0902]|uniref:GNAT family N-acetyltransferase n=1 Tax=Leptolyngbya sp. BL0902 TaxID=1115757 RepID=UPI0018E7446E|nr:GNAT family N-acetyltransferase [Leptolyngbya sp. BL0902]QQE65580.1 GNAT family N-acetyltransferase [Leptolyngbya sp. BL0902]